MAPPRATWKGFLRLSLVSVPVRAFTANATASEVHLNQLHKGCNNRIRYQKVCPQHGEVQGEDIVSGYEYAKGQYVVVDPDELDKLRKESDRSVNIDGFIKADQLDPIYHSGRTYYLLPDGTPGQKPYQLLQRALVEDGLVAIAQVVLTGREQVVLLRPLDGLLAMTVLEHQSHVKLPDAFKDEIAEASWSDEEMRLTKMLVEASRKETFEFGAYKDTYTEKLTQLIQMKVDGQEVVQVADTEKPQIVNFMEALKQSVAAAQKMAPSAREKAAPATPAKKKKSG
jgi:DNA end-binding protein Ku